LPKHRKHLSADQADVRGGNDEDEVIASDVAHEAAMTEQSFHHVVQDPRQNVNHPVAVVVAVPVVVFLEMIQIGVADREFLGALEAAPDFPLDFRGARHAGGRMHRHVALAAQEQGFEPGALFRRREDAGENFVRPGGEPRLHLLGIVRPREDQGGNDRGERVALQVPDELEAGCAHPVGVDEQKTGVAPEDDGLDLGRVGKGFQGEALAFGPLPDQVRESPPDRSEVENGRTSAHPSSFVRVYPQAT
jgi:hypothetical protein